MTVKKKKTICDTFRTNSTPHYNRTLPELAHWRRIEWKNETETLTDDQTGSIRCKQK